MIFIFHGTVISVSFSHYSKPFEGHSIHDHEAVTSISRQTELSAYLSHLIFNSSETVGKVAWFSDCEGWMESGPVGFMREVMVYGKLGNLSATFPEVGPNMAL